MPNIAFISPKGGVGKTTACLLLALGLAERGERVAIIDSDPNKPLIRWAALPDRPELISVHAAPTAPDIRDAAREAQRREPDWLIMDTEGSERGAMAFAALRFDLVLTPVSGSQLDLHEAVKAADMVRSFGRRGGRALTHRAVLSRIPAAIKPRMLKSVVSQLREAEVEILPTPLIDKEAFRTLFFSGGGFDGLESQGVWGAGAAHHNASRFVADVIELIQAPAAGYA
ncbi:MAG TPA: ParA family protein [Caulobacteraceae bacterium]|jgi:chromosome partitioning protein